MDPSSRGRPKPALLRRVDGRLAGPRNTGVAPTEELRGRGRWAIITHSCATMADVVDLTLSSDESDGEVAVVTLPPAKRVKSESGGSWLCSVRAPPTTPPPPVTTPLVGQGATNFSLHPDASQSGGRRSAR